MQKQAVASCVQRGVEGVYGRCCQQCLLRETLVIQQGAVLQGRRLGAEVVFCFGGRREPKRFKQKSNADLRE
jgi:hypothetical protein